MTRDRFGVTFWLPQVLCFFLVVGSPCPPGRDMTDEIAQDEIESIEYTSEELEACLDTAVLVRNLNTMSFYPWTKEQIDVVKAKLNQTGYPDSVLHNLAGFMDSMGPEDVKEWRINSTETLESLLTNDPAPTPELATEIIKHYLNSGGPLNAAALNVLGKRDICLLDPKDLQAIDENTIKGLNPMNFSNCDQATKDVLYSKAKRAFSDQHNKDPGFYYLIKPYLGGASADDLRALSKYKNIAMDIDTFMQLKPESRRQLTPSIVKGLMGENVKDLKTHKEEPPVKDWIIRQPQSELDKLGVGLTGGRPEGYINITTRQNNSPQARSALGGPILHLFASLFLTLLLASYLS